MPTHDLIVLARTRRSSKLEGTVAIAQTQQRGSDELRQPRDDRISSKERSSRNGPAPTIPTATKEGQAPPEPMTVLSQGSVSDRDPVVLEHREHIFFGPARMAQLDRCLDPLR